MNNKFVNIFSATIIGTSVLFSCAPKKKTVATPVIETPKIQAPKVEDLGVLVPFTREIFFKLRDNGLDIKKLKFYVDNTIALNKISSSGNLEINEGGILVNKKGLAENLIKVTPQVAGMVESVEPDGLKLNFGRPNSTLKFVNNTLSPKFFNFSGEKVDKATGNTDVTYNGSTYRATCEGCSNVTDVKLLIRQLDIDAGIGKGTIEPGAGNRSILSY